ncbi:MAG: nitroreductase family protein [Candidatus Heimdallarchaeota archaeon]|nr:nitroreductase family protein [Candidatus Heimdallarchaeota archaeon]MCK4954218.1 nitroreductase family protein [Candidatus Heimdallarchaeota archaeon]
MVAQPKIEILDTCIACKNCVDVCPRYIFEIENKKAVTNQNLFRCHDCGHCVAVCSEDAIIHHRLIENALEEDFPRKGKKITYEQVLETIRQRRSIRCFSKKKVTKEQINQLITLGRYAPTGHNERKVCYTIINDRKELEFLLDNMIELFKKLKKQLNSKLWNLLAGLTGKREFFTLAKKNLYRLESHIANWEKGIDTVLHYSSTLFLIHAHEETSVPIEDCNIAAQNIALGAPTLGLGATFLGYVQKSWGYSKRIKEIINIPNNHTIYACLTVGYPKNEYKRLVPRPEPDVKFKN